MKTCHRYAVKNMAGRKQVFQREADMSRRIRLKPHPCIVEFYSIYDFPERGFYMIVMELCPRGNAEEFVKKVRQDSRGTPYSPPDVVRRWIGHVFLGLEHLHKQMESLLRDLKPANVVISEPGVAKLTDFGFGREGTQTTGFWSFQAPPGSPGYVAPEILMQQPADTSSDLYSFGVLIWVMLTGGVTSDSNPRPPVTITPRGRAPNFNAFANDCEKLKQCIDNPSANSALPVPAYAKDLVLALIQREKAKRPKHSDIRQYAVMQELDLPAFDSSRQSVQAWLNASSENSRASSSGACVGTGF
jgi:serine/threonine protein kinase